MDFLCNNVPLLAQAPSFASLMDFIIAQNIATNQQQDIVELGVVHVITARRSYFESDGTKRFLERS